MNPRQLSITLAGDSDTKWPNIAIGETVDLNLDCRDPDSGAVLDLTGLNVKFALSDPTSVTPTTLLMDKSATISTPATGAAKVSLLPADYAPDAKTLKPGFYRADAWIDDGGTTRKSLGYGTIRLTGTVRPPV